MASFSLSQIPESAVVMPGDGVNSIGALDVEFGALDFGTEAFEMEPQSSPKSAPSAQPQSQPSPLTNKYPTGVNAGGMDSAPTPASQASLDMDPYAKAAALSQNLKVRFIQLTIFLQLIVEKFVNLFCSSLCSLVGHFITRASVSADSGCFSVAKQ